eukprot:m51a1_g13742 hypothetical protein (243) ;mRNA; r:176794-177691
MEPARAEIVIHHGVRYKPDLVLPFYSHTRRTQAEQSEDRALGINRNAFSNLFAQHIDLGPAFEALGLIKPDWASSENAFQAAKCSCVADQRFVAGLSPGDAAKYGQGRMPLQDADRARLVQMGARQEDFVKRGAGWRRTATGRVPLVPRWDERKLDVMLAALRAKFVRTELSGLMRALQGHNVLFVEHTANDVQWADGGDGSGMNMLGKMLTQVFLEIRSGSTWQPDPAFLHAPNSEIVRYL